MLLSGSKSSFLLLPVLPVGVALLTLWEFLRQPDVPATALAHGRTAV